MKCLIHNNYYLFITIFIIIFTLGREDVSVADGGDANLIHACVKQIQHHDDRDHDYHHDKGKVEGSVLIVGPDDECPPKWSHLHWSIQGPPGDDGKEGPVGPPGPPGADGKDLTNQLCELYELTGKIFPLICKDCGNGILEPMEECDDSNTENGDGCNSDCLVERCGNGIVDIGEECDDGNTVESDGCNSFCEINGKTVFLSSYTYSGDLGGLEGADEKCNDLASAVGLPGTYMAWLSDSTVSVSDRISHSSVAYIRVDGVVVAEDWNDLVDGELMSPINVDQNGIQHSLRKAWTGTQVDGNKIVDRTSIYYCEDWTTDIYHLLRKGTPGYSDKLDSSWTFSPEQFCKEHYHLYCFQQ